MGRAPCCEKVGLKRGPWTPEEDEKLIAFINEHGHGSWRALPKKAGLLRCGKSCRLRWTNYLRPDIKRGEFSATEENAILQLHALLGNRWSAIASHLPQRTDNEIKNYWNTHLKKKLVKMGLDPTTHKPVADSVILTNNSGSPTDTSGTAGIAKLGNTSSSCNKSSTTVNTSSIIDINTSINDQDGAAAASLLLRSASPLKGSNSATMHLTQWESVRLEAEARLTQEAKMRAKGAWHKSSPILPNSVAGPPSLSNPGLHAGSHSCAAGAFKTVSAVELMHALHNWEKSLQGQAGLLWPESWRVAAITASPTSCCSHSDSSSSSSPAAATPDGAAATSSMSLCSLDSARKPSEAVQIGTGCRSVNLHGGGCPRSPQQKLSWSDALMPPKYPSLLPNPTIDVCRQGSSRGSFSSLMLDAVLGRSLAVQGPISAHAPKLEALGSGDKKEEILEVVTKHEAELVDKHHLDEASNVSVVTGEMQQDDSCTDDEDIANDDDDERSLSVDGTSDLFRDLPKLKRDATTTRVSYTALLSEEISDYWSNMVLKEQIASPTIHLTF